MIGQQISHYRITDRISSGASGTVYKADDLTLRRTVAIKVIKPSHQDPNIANKRFLREAQAISQIDHPNVISVFEVVQKGAANFLVMQYAPGSSLRDKIEKGLLSAVDAIKIASGIAGGLQAAHDVGVVHRDIKPENVVVDDPAGAKVLDFGVAHLIDRSTLTRRGKIVGTLPYMAPEQIRGDLVDARTDVYAVGVVLYEMLTGKLPFESSEESAFFYQIVNVVPEPVETLVPGLPAGIGKVVSKAVAKKPADRYQTAGDMKHDLDIVLRRAQKASGEPAEMIAKTRPWRRLGISIGLIVATAVAVALWRAVC